MLLHTEVLLRVLVNHAYGFFPPMCLVLLLHWQSHAPYFDFLWLWKWGEKLWPVYFCLETNRKETSSLWNLFLFLFFQLWNNSLCIFHKHYILLSHIFQTKCYGRVYPQHVQKHFEVTLNMLVSLLMMKKWLKSHTWIQVKICCTFCMSSSTSLVYAHECAQES